MYTQKRNGQIYNFLPIEPPQPPPSSFYHYHYPEDPSAPPPDTPVVVQSSVLTATSNLSFDIFQSDNKSHHTIKLKTKDSEQTQLLEEEERKKKAPFNFRFIYLVTIVEIILFGVSILKNHGFEPFSVNPMIGPSAQVLLELGASDDELILNNGQWWRFITPIFLHAGLIHLVFNLIFQLQQGIPLEREFGSFRILPLYIVSGVVGNLMSCIFLPTIMSVGASGSLFGLMGAMLAAMLKNWKSLRRPCVGIVFLSLIISFNLFIGLLPHIDNFAHVGGLLAGFLYGLALIPSFKSSFTNGALACFGFMTASIGIGAGFFLFYTRFDMNNWCTWCKYIDCLPVLGWCSGY